MSCLLGGTPLLLYFIYFVHSRDVSITAPLTRYLSFRAGLRAAGSGARAGRGRGRGRGRRVAAPAAGAEPTPVRCHVSRNPSLPGTTPRPARLRRQPQHLCGPRASHKSVGFLCSSAKPVQPHPGRCPRSAACAPDLPPKDGAPLRSFRAPRCRLRKPGSDPAPRIVPGTGLGDPGGRLPSGRGQGGPHGT